MKIPGANKNPLLQTYTSSDNLELPRHHVVLSLVKWFGYLLMVLAALTNPALFVFLIGFVLVRVANSTMETSFYRHLDKAFEIVGTQLDLLKGKGQSNPLEKSDKRNPYSASSDILDPRLKLKKLRDNNT